MSTLTVTYDQLLEGDHPTPWTVAKHQAFANHGALVVTTKTFTTVVKPGRKLTVDGEAYTVTDIREPLPVEEDDELEDEVDEHACPDCDFVSKSAAGLAAHTRAKHPDEA